mgnify:CR=1 FL=1
MKIGIIVAMEKEFTQLKSLLEEQHAEQHNGKHFILGQLGHHELVMMQCGIGKVNAAVGAVEMIDHYHPELVISTGVAGGADVTMNITEVVVSTECVYHDCYCGSECERGQLLGLPPTFKSPQDLVLLALSMNDMEHMNIPKIHAGQIVTGDWFVDSQDKMRSILSDFPHAKAVDMESCAIAHTCHLYSTPFISFRIISDIPLKDDKAAQYFDFWARMAEGSFNVTRHFLQQIV